MVGVGGNLQRQFLRHLQRLGGQFDDLRKTFYYY
jgi:hypothetical protein